MITKIRKFVFLHKTLSSVVAVVCIAAGYYWYSSSRNVQGVTTYVVQKAANGTVLASVTGSGQVQAVTQIDIKPQVSETVATVLAGVGDKVKAGQLLVQLDTKTEARALAQAKLQLQSTQLSLAKLTEAPATTTLIQDQNAVAQAQSNIVADSTALDKDYQTGFDTLASAFVDFQNIMSGLQSFTTGGDIVKAEGDPDAYLNLMPIYLQASTQPYRDNVYATYSVAVAAYQQNLADYHVANRAASPQALDGLFAETYHTAQSVSEAVKAAKDFLNYVVNNHPTIPEYTPLPAITNTLQTNMGAYTNTASADIGNLAGIMSAVASDNIALANARLTLNQASSTLAQLLAGPDSIDVQSSQVTIRQQELAVQTAEQNLADDSIRAPIDGVISAIPAVAGATVPSPAASIIGQRQIAQITLNEVDAAKVNVGDKAILTFDAVSGLSLAGQVIEFDPVGTVSQGVVSYNVQIALAAPNDKVKPGMSVNASIVTQIEQNVLVVPSAAVIAQGSAKYIREPSTPLSDADIAASAKVGVPLSAAPKLVPVTVGISNNAETEIVSGANPGDQVIVRTVNSAASLGASAGTLGGPNVFRALGGFRGGGGPGQ